ncbi:MAG: hypothetical protein RLZZ493_550 [Bacteroidota bacterium]
MGINNNRSLQANADRETNRLTKKYVCTFKQNFGDRAVSKKNCNKLLFVGQISNRTFLIQTPPTPSNELFCYRLPQQ